MNECVYDICAAYNILLLQNDKKLKATPLETRSLTRSDNYMKTTTNEKRKTRRLQKMTKPSKSSNNN